MQRYRGEMSQTCSVMRVVLLICLFASGALAQTAPPIEPGVPQELAKWRAARYSDIRYKLNLTLEKMSPVLKGTIEIRLKMPKDVPNEFRPPIVLDWRKIKGSESLSTITNISINGRTAMLVPPPDHVGLGAVQYWERDEHLIFDRNVLEGENVIKLDFTSPILTSGSAITRYIDKEDGSEYIYSLFVPSDASTAFPVFDQPDLKARFSLNLSTPDDWRVVSNTFHAEQPIGAPPEFTRMPSGRREYKFAETLPISTYVFAFAVGPWGQFTDIEKYYGQVSTKDFPVETRIFVRKSQYGKAGTHTRDIFRLNREAIRYFEQYFDYKFPFPKYDLVLIPEFPFGGMEHAGATFLRESAIIFPQEPTKGDLISRSILIFHETAHQWFGDTVTMRWFDDLWLKEGFATFMAYKALEKVMPEANAWKVFYERVKQAAYQTDSTRGTTAIYQPIANLSAAKSAYGNIVYNKAPAFLRQAEFYLGEDKFQTAVRTFLRKNEFKNAGWEDLVKEFEAANQWDLKDWGQTWVKNPGVTSITDRPSRGIASVYSSDGLSHDEFTHDFMFDQQTSGYWPMKTKAFLIYKNGARESAVVDFQDRRNNPAFAKNADVDFIFGNYQDYSYGIFLLDDKSREYVLKNIQNEKDPFLRSMMWGALWDSVREAELDPRVYIELAIKNLPGEDDESIGASILGRTSTAMNYYVADKPRDELAPKLESLLLERIKGAATLGQRITFYRAFLNASKTDPARQTLKDILAGKMQIAGMALKTKDRFDIVTRLMVLNDPDASKLLADIERTETSNDAKRYAYAAKAGFPNAENKAKYWNDFVNNKDISESWIEAAFGPWNSIRHSELTLPYLERALKELPNHKRSRKIFFVNGWLGAFIGGQRDERALAIINKFLADNPTLDNDLRLKILENMDVIERAVNIRKKSAANDTNKKAASCSRPPKNQVITTLYSSATKSSSKRLSKRFIKRTGSLNRNRFAETLTTTPCPARTSSNW